MVFLLLKKLGRTWGLKSSFIFLLKVWVYYVPCIFKFDKTEVLFLPTEKNGLSFIETSSLDSTNVEAAFQTILTGKTWIFRLDQWELEIIES